MASILVIDDDESMAMAVESWLVFMGHQVHIAFSGREGLDWLTDHDCDLVLLDRYLFDMEGPTVCRTMRSDGKNMAIIMVTGAISEDFRKSSVDAGATGVLEKPFDVEGLQQAVNEALSNALLGDGRAKP